MRHSDISLQLPYQLVIFDVDGTLVDSFVVFIQLLNECAQKYRFQYLDAEKIEALRMFAPRQIRRELKISRFKAILMAIECKHKMQSCQTPVRFSGIDQLLHNLKQQGYQLALVTSNSEKNCRFALGNDLFSVFDWVETDASIYGKQRKIRKVLRYAQCAREDAIYIGDQISDIHSAQKNGVSVGAVGWGFNHPEVLKAHQPDHFFNVVEDIAALLLPQFKWTASL